MGQKVEETAKGKVLEAYVVQACVCGMGTLVLTEKQDDNMHLAENNWVLGIPKREDRRKMVELRK